jgi:hypothetical protein
VTAIGLFDILTSARQGRIPERIDFRPTPLLAQAVRRTLKACPTAMPPLPSPISRRCSAGCGRP